MSILQLADAKAHMSVYVTDDDEMIQSKIDASETWLGSFLGAALSTFTVVTNPDNTTTTVPLPDPLSEATRQLVSHLYNNREASLVGTNIVENCPGMFDLLGPYRCYVF